MTKKRTNPIEITPGTSIGNNEAEADDQYLISCFLDHPAYADVVEIGSPKMFLLGRTGAGKTAILRMIEHQEENVSNIDLHDMSMNYIANSDILRFIQSIGFDLDLFFQVLWKHVLCIEIIRLRYSIQNESDSKNIFTAIENFFSRDQRKKEAIKYLKKWEGKFWITMDVNIKDITEYFEKELSAEFSAEIKKFMTKAGTSKKVSESQKKELVSRAKKIVNEKLLIELNRVMELLAEYETKTKYNNCYILIDRLDEKWVDENIRFTLIRALIESLKKFRKIRYVKIIVAMRPDVIERVVLENKDLGFQREKYDDYFLSIVWQKSQLFDLVQKRINQLYRKRYTSENIFFKDIFPLSVGRIDPFDYLLERTLYRPRDIISFINKCLFHAQGKTEVSPKIIKEAEADYSQNRMQALVQEWKSAFPSLSIILKLFSGRKSRLSYHDFTNESFIEEFILNYDDTVKDLYDPFHKLTKQYLESSQTKANGICSEIAKKMISQLYRVGVVGVKLSADERVQYAHFDTPYLAEERISSDAKVYIHKMLHRALAIDSR